MKFGIPFQYRVLNKSNHPASGSEEPWVAVLKSCITAETLSLPYSVLIAFSASEILPCCKIIHANFSEYQQQNYCVKLLTDIQITR